MERYIGGTEIQLGVIPLTGKVPDNEEVRNMQIRRVVDNLITANNKTRLYGVPSTNKADGGNGGICTWLFNGGLIYADMSHPEYATPECKSLDEIVYYEIAGRKIIDGLLRLQTFTNPTHGIFANNTDHHGATFAYHENYLAKHNPNNQIEQLLPFLVTRQIICGAGVVLTQALQTHLRLRDKLINHSIDAKTCFAISQRSLAAQFIQNVSVPQLRIGQYSKFAGANRHNSQLLHITGGDANFTKDTTKLKIGTTALVHQIVEDGFQIDESLLISEKVAYLNLTRIALDPNFEWIYNTGRYICPAIEVQRIYLENAKFRFAGRDADTDWTLRMWEVSLNQLETNPLKATWIDWVRKFNFIAPRFSSHKWKEEELVKVDLSFHAADPDKSILTLFGDSRLEDDKIVYAMHHPPKDTRAAGRGVAIKALDRILEQSESYLPTITWNYIEFAHGAFQLKMPDSRKNYLKEAEKFKRLINSYNLKELFKSEKMKKSS